MKGLLEEILEIPDRAKECFEKNKTIRLPTNVPYLGMGSSYYAPLTLFYAGADINPQIASEYYYYLKNISAKSAVLLSQSGKSTETVWCSELFDSYTAITNFPKSPLAMSSHIAKLVQLYAGDEQFSSTKTYVNTLIVLYLGLGINPKKAVEQISKRFDEYKSSMQQEAKKIASYIKKHRVNGLYIIGSGPNIGTAMETALTLSETTKLAWIGMPVAQYDHGPKETANNTVVVILNSNGKDRKRIESVKKTVKNLSNALVVELYEENVEEQLSPLTLISRANLLMNYLADELGVGNTFELGGKVTTVDDSVK